jgi:hypothetical protein
VVEGPLGVKNGRPPCEGALAHDDLPGDFFGLFQDSTGVAPLRSSIRAWTITAAEQLDEQLVAQRIEK